MEKIEADYNTKGMKFHFEFDPKTQTMSIYGPESTYYAMRGPLMAQLRVQDWWTGFEQARVIVDRQKGMR